MKIGVLRGRENSFPEAFIAKVNSMGKGVRPSSSSSAGPSSTSPSPIASSSIA